MAALTPQHRPERELPRRGWRGSLFYMLFSLVLLIPRLRSARRKSKWPLARGVLFAAGGACLLGAAFSQKTGLAAFGAGLLILGAVASPIVELEPIQSMAERCGALSTLNGGVVVSGVASAKPGAPVQLLVTQDELYVVSTAGPPAECFKLADVSEVRVDGAPYRPGYVSFAKAPPSRDVHSTTASRAELRVSFTDGRALELSYAGAFARHLAEIAAYTILTIKAFVPGQEKVAVRGNFVSAV